MVCLLLVAGGAVSDLDGGAADMSTGQPSGGQPAASLHVKDTYMVEMHDGVSLATDVYLQYEGYPSHGSVLMRTPYNKDVISLFHPR